MAGWRFKPYSVSLHKWSRPMQTHNKPRSDLIEALPDELAKIKDAKATLVFIGQAWINERAREVDDSRYTFDIGLNELYQGATGEWRDIHSTGVGHYISDGFRSHPNAPEPATKWQGPFEIKLKSWSE